jgi:hypothetical protein
MDLWVADNRESRGLGIELKYLMSGQQAATVPAQAQRLRQDGANESAAFILWGHGLDEHSPDKLFVDADEGWTHWTREGIFHVDAEFRGSNRLSVWLFASDRE